jgi:ABC-type multidrug transport system fused ATPase/permease subunit
MQSHSNVKVPPVPLTFGTYFAPLLVEMSRANSIVRLLERGRRTAMNVQEFLAEKQVVYESIAHRDTYDAQRLAQVLHTPGREVAKTVLLRADAGYTYIVAVLPANKTIDFDKVSAAFGGSKIELANEFEIKQHCPDCEMGAPRMRRLCSKGTAITKRFACVTKTFTVLKSH